MLKYLYYEITEIGNAEFHSVISEMLVWLIRWNQIVR